MIVALYRPSTLDPTSGPIVQTLETQEEAVPAAAAAMGLKWVEFDPPATPDALFIAMRLDSTHSVQRGKITPKPTIAIATQLSIKGA